MISFSLNRYNPAGPSVYKIGGSNFLTSSDEDDSGSSFHIRISTLRRVFTAKDAGYWIKRRQV